MAAAFKTAKKEIFQVVPAYPVNISIYSNVHGRALGQAQTTQRAVHAAVVHLGPCGAGRPFVRALTHSLRQPGLTRTPVPPVAQHGAVQPICPYMLPTCTPLDVRRVALHLFPQRVQFVQSACARSRIGTVTRRGG